MIKDFFSAVLGYLDKYWGFYSALWSKIFTWGGAVLGIFLFALSVLDGIYQLGQYAYAELGKIAGQSRWWQVTFPSGFEDSLAFANYIFPLNEVWLLVVVSLTTFSVTTVIRIIKAWVPTVA